MTAHRGDDEFDVLVIGGGPAGSSLAGHLARRGVRVVVVEGKRFPREHIGESLLAASMPILTELGVVPKLEEWGAPRKRGAVFIWGPTDEPMKLDMPRPGHAFQVRRGRFDTMLLNHAADLGATVWQEHWVKEPLWDRTGRMCGATVAAAAQAPRPVHARFVVDASGLFQFLPKRLGLPITTFGPRRVALTSYYEGASRHEPPYEEDIISEACEDGWIWFIPLDDKTTSVGFVGDEDDLRGTPQQMLERQLAGSTLTRELLAGARNSRQAKVLKYTNHAVETPLWTDGYLLIGDSAIFVDPLFSTGVHGSLYSGASAAAGIVSVLNGTLAEEQVADWFDTKFRAHYGRIQQMIRLLYGLHPGTSRFWRSRDLSSTDTAEAERIVGAIGVAGIDFFARTSASGHLALPEPLRRLIGELPYQLRPFSLPMDTVLSLAAEVVIESGLMRSAGELVPSMTVRHLRARTQEIEFDQGGFLHRLFEAVDGRRDLATVIGLADRGNADREKIAVLAGSLVDGGLLRVRTPGRLDQPVLAGNEVP